jgi:hypothetical protein
LEALIAPFQCISGFGSREFAASWCISTTPARAERTPTGGMAIAYSLVHSGKAHDHGIQAVRAAGLRGRMV